MVTKCVHTDRPFYARGMCKNCYHKVGRSKPANCHKDKAHYSKGLCHNCYMKEYTRTVRNERRISKEKAVAENPGLFPPKAPRKGQRDRTEETLKSMSKPEYVSSSGMSPKLEP